jgi:hypothetical protein
MIEMCQFWHIFLSFFAAGTSIHEILVSAVQHGKELRMGYVRGSIWLDPQHALPGIPMRPVLTIIRSGR